MPPTNFLRELAAAGITLAPEPRARLRLALLGRTLTFTASPWSARLTRAEPQVAVEPVPPEPVEPDDLIAEIADLGEHWSKGVPLVCDGPNLHTTKATGGEPDATAWGFLSPTTARRRTDRAARNRYDDALHYLARDCADFTAAVVAHHLDPNAKTAAEVRLCGIRAAGQIVAMVKRVTP